MEATETEISKEDLLKSFEELCKNNNGSIVSTEDENGNDIITCEVEDGDDFNKILEGIEKEDGFMDMIKKSLPSDTLPTFKIDCEQNMRAYIPYFDESEDEYAGIYAKKSYTLEPYTYW